MNQNGGRGANMRGNGNKGNGMGGGRNNGGAFGNGGFCICTKCGEKVPHERGVKCTTQKCPVCGHTLVREELVQQKQNAIQQ
ncbi:MAG: hypothetical protein EOL93_01455 [Epsilonproteobacteria bacterium]|nr:hypothetical protein [Campylobacterota bacterium]